MKTLFKHVSSGTNTRFMRHLACLFLLLGSTGAYGNLVTVQHSTLRVSLDTMNAQIMVKDKDTTHVWTQNVLSGYSVKTGWSVIGNVITATVTDGTNDYPIQITLRADPEKAFHLSVTPPGPDPLDPYPYVELPLYPFLYRGTNMTEDWYYVQNNGGEGTMRLIDDTTTRGQGGWAGSQPWWGVTNLTEAMMARLDSFVQVQNPTDNKDPSAYKIPLQIEYSFYNTDGYVGLAKAYRDYLLDQYKQAHNQEDLPKLEERAGDNQDLYFLKNGTYAYFWDDDLLDSENVGLIEDMTDAGLTNIIAMFSLGDDPSRVDDLVYNKIATYGWRGGMYRIPTPNLSTICPDVTDWVNKLLLHEVDQGQNVTEQYILDKNANHLHNGNPDPVNEWDQLDTASSEPAWLTGACAPMAGCDSGLPYLANNYKDNLKVIYHDTLPQQLGPSFYDDPNPNNPDYIESIEENRDGRQKILDDTRSYTNTNHPSHFLAGSGEGVSAWWTVGHLDYWEGGMEESIYGDIKRHPILDHCYEFADDDFPCGADEVACKPNYTPGDICSDTNEESWVAEETECLDDQHRIPLLALQWHDYVAETWNWRDSTFVVASLSWKKDLFNILYGTMPMWHVTKALWDAHQKEYVDSYWKLRPVREANGFAEMTDHHWADVAVQGDKLAQHTDWDSGKRVIVNFSDTGDYTYPNTDGIDPDYGSIIIPPHGYAMLPDLVSQNCEGSLTPPGWTDSSTNLPNSPEWDYIGGLVLEGSQSLYLPSTIGTSGSSTYVDFADQPEVWVYFKLRLTTTSQGTKTIAKLADNTGSTIAEFQVSTSGELPSFGGKQTGTGFSSNAVNVWLHYRKGTGSNGIVDIAWSTDGTKLTDSNHFGQLTTYTNTNDAARLLLGTSVHTAFDIVFDSIRVAYAEIKNVP